LHYFDLPFTLKVVEVALLELTPHSFMEDEKENTEDSDEDTPENGDDEEDGE